MKVAILGASGIVGQHMRLCVPAGIDPVWVRLHPDAGHVAVNLEDAFETMEFLRTQDPDAVVNLAGENRVDIVEQYPDETHMVNVELPKLLGRWARAGRRRYVHASSQAVFGGEAPPYFPDSVRHPINAYGRQKAEAEVEVGRAGGNAAIARHDDCPGLAPRPVNTAYGSIRVYQDELTEGLERCRRDWNKLKAVPACA